jgi:hypothetical protein
MNRKFDTYMEKLTENALFGTATMTQAVNEKLGLDMTAKQSGWVQLNVYIQCLTATISALRTLEDLEPFTPNEAIKFSQDLIDALLPHLPVDDPVVYASRMEREAQGN